MASRAAAVDLLRLTANGFTLDQALEACRSFNELEGADRGFARALASTTLRRRGTLDEVIAAHLKVPLKPKQTYLRDIMRITAAQLCLMGTEDHAAAWSAVELAKLRVESKGYTKLVNAIARRLAENGKELAEKQPLRADTPGWLWRKLARAYGTKTASAIAEAHRIEPPLDISLKDPSATIEWPEELGARKIGPRTVRMASAPVPSLPGFEEGAWWVQDVAATLPAEILGAREGEKVFDLCAAPGGKTMQLAATGAEVFAIDHSGLRLERLHANLQRTGLEAVVLEQDLLEWSPANPADRILLDAPCSATGTIRRNPDLLWTSRETQVPDLVRLQKKMLEKALDLLKPGGTLVYAVCSLLPEEGEEQVAALLERRGDVERVPVTSSEIGDLPVINKQGEIRCLPSKLKADGGMDGFFAARLQKKG
ncbi:RsmB/NOP family class I SAM-dependent RNA methyltransferase [Parvularcula lutaonensis]|uniref:RsmB/NOP family class I SAM-dependent RNA methyltransferase n=1 Tax=Parvularcula lutaonensis TaxID=491923 RepID=A0ABV7M9S8_9PROT|nr:RsmB/NOP family class I SAM-dependent RNA methyltransferase [Parvularcula lutaonensis]GGY47719.1 MFS transporter [Parvularcula lutaonensis]